MDVPCPWEHKHVPTKRVGWVAERTVILWLMDASLVTQDISVYMFRHELDCFLPPLLRARGLEEMAMQRLVCSPRDWKLMVALAVCEYVLMAPNVRMKGIVWSIEKLHASLMPSMVVTVVPLELSDADVKDGAIVGSNGVLLAKH